MLAAPVTADSTRAWVATVAVALANGTAFGTAYTFGTFFDSMADELGAERGSTAVMFGITLLFFFGFGVVSGPLSDRVGAHRLLVIGGVVFVVGLCATSQVSSLWLGYISYGVGVGLGGGFFVAPLTALVGRLFVTHRALALGVTATGNGLGTLILVPLAARLIDENGWRSAYLILAAVAAVVFLLALPAISVVPPGGLAGPGHAATPMRELATPKFRSLFVSSILMSIGLFVAFAFIVPFATDNGVSSAAAARLVALIGLSSIVGRLVLTGFTGRWGAVRVFQASLALQPIAYVIWLVADGDYGLLVLFASVLGVAYGGFVAVAPEVVIEQFGVQDLGKRMGVLFLSFGIGGLIGPPSAGFISDATSGQSVAIVTVIVIVVAALAAAWPLSGPPERDRGQEAERWAAT